MKKKVVGLLVALTVLSLLVSFFIWAHPVRLSHRRQCYEKLKLLGNAIKTYQVENQGQLPQQLSILSNELSNPIFLICPGTGHTPGSFSNVETWSDYILVDWAAIRGTNIVTGDFPIAYDRSIRNHAGDGINVLTADGVVHWDSKGEWLEKFAQEHSYFKLPLFRPSP